MNYEEMSDFRINKMVSDALGLETVRYPHAADKRSVGVKNSEVHFEWFDYCNNPSDAWPIIVSMISGGCVVQMLQAGVIVTLQGGGRIQAMDKNTLRAAMILFLMMQEQSK